MADGLRYRIAAGSCALLALTWPASAAEGPPKRGGTLTYLIPADSPPSFDGHREGTFAMVHATAPFYSTLIRINPVNPSSTTDFVCDLCTGMPEPGDSGKTYVFELRNGVKFHDGTPLTAADVKASWDHIISPPEGVLSRRHLYLFRGCAARHRPCRRVMRRVPSSIRPAECSRSARTSRRRGSGRG